MNQILLALDIPHILLQTEIKVLMKTTMKSIQLNFHQNRKVLLNMCVYYNQSRINRLLTNVLTMF